MDQQQVENILKQRKKHICTDCEKRFDVLTSLQTHMKKEHKTTMQKLPIQKKAIREECNICGSNVKELNKHLTRVHEVLNLPVELTENQKKPIELIPLPEISNEKPRITQKQMVAHAIKNYLGKATLQEIHEYIKLQFPYYAEKKEAVVSLVENVMRVHKNCFSKEKEIIQGKSKNTYRIEYDEWVKNKNRQKAVKPDPKSSKNLQKNLQKKAQKTRKNI